MIGPVFGEPEVTALMMPVSREVLGQRCRGEAVWLCVEQSFH